MPTLADLAGVSSLLPPEIDGLSVAPTLLGRGRQKKHKCLYWEWPFYDWKKKNYPDNGLMQAVRSGKWKLLRHRQDEPWQLYDLSNDIGEKNDIAADHPKVVERLTKWIAANRTEPRPQIEPKAPEGKRYR